MDWKRNQIKKFLKQADELHNIEDMLSDGLREVSGLEPITRSY